MANGTIKRLVRDRGFGFIRDDGGQEWFFHRSSVKTETFEQLNEGQRVAFDEPSAKGPRAGTSDQIQQLRNRRLRLVKNRRALAEPRAWFCCARDRLGLYR